MQGRFALQGPTTVCQGAPQNAFPFGGSQVGQIANVCNLADRLGNNSPLCLLHLECDRQDHRRLAVTDLAPFI